MGFVKSETDQRRVLIIDVSHLFYKYAWGASGLSATIKEGNEIHQVDTTLPTYTIKQIHRWSKGGLNPTIVCFDGQGSTKSRTGYFIKNKLRESNEIYKEGRERQTKDFYDGANITMNLLIQGGVCCLKAAGYEADDLIKAAIDKAKETYPDLPIDVITGDADLVPLVDEQVSVFLSSKKMTWAESKDIEKAHYVQLRPENYQMYMEGLTEFKGLDVPYNTVLLKKLLRGDKTDNIPAYPKFTPTKYNNLIAGLEEKGFDFARGCRYDNPTETICYRGTEEPIPLELLDSTPNEQKMIKFGEPPALTYLLENLEGLVDEDVIRHVRTVYNGINLNGAFVGLTPELNRRPAKMKSEVKGYYAGDLQKAVSIVQIHLPLV